MRISVKGMRTVAGVIALGAVCAWGQVAIDSADMRWRAERECLPVVSVSASSSARGNAAANSIDRNLASRWQPSTGGRQWITYDLGAAREVGAASIVWYSSKSAGATFTVQVSANNKEYTVVDAGQLVGRGTHTALRTFVAQKARYVRIGLDIPAGAAAPCLYEVGLHGSASDVAVK